MAGSVRQISAVTACVVILALNGCAKTQPARSAEKDWAVKGAPYRVTIEVDAQSTPWADAPAGAAIDFGRLLADAGVASTERLDAASIRVVPAGGAKPIPHHASSTLAAEQTGRVWWRLRDPKTTTYHVYFNVGRPSAETYPKVFGLIGIGDALRHNHGQPGLSQPTALHSQMWLIDWDGDGARDLIGFGYREYEYGEELAKNLGNAVYFQKNLGTSVKPLFAPRYRMKDAAGAYLSTTLLPQNIFPTDWGGDGRIDFIGVSAINELLLWKNSGKRDPNGLWLLEPPRAVTKLAGMSDFRRAAHGPAQPARYSTRGVHRCDYEGDQDLIVTWRTVGIIRKDVDPKRGVIPYGTPVQFFELWRNNGDDKDGSPSFADPVVLTDDSGVMLHARGAASGGGAYADWDGDGDFDLLYHEDDNNLPIEDSRLMFAENDGTRGKPIFLMPLPLHKVRSSPQVLDWNDDGNVDLFSGNEFFENVNPRTRRMSTTVPSTTLGGSRKPHAWSYPQLVSRGFAQQVQPDVISYFAIAVDWENDGDLDLVQGYQSYMRLIRNTGTSREPVFEPPIFIKAGGKRIQMANNLDLAAGPPTHWGPQGPAELKYGWLVPSMIDWDGDGDLDLFVTGQRWQVMYFENTSTRKKPAFARGREVRCDGNPHEFSWRSKVSLGDLDGDGDPELVVTSDQDNSFYAYRPALQQPDKKALELVRGDVLRLEDGKPVQGWYGGQNNNGDNHSQLVDWDGDGDLDLINGTLWTAWLYENVGTKREPRFAARGKVQAGGTHIHTFNHAGSFDAADWNGDGRVDLIMGAECPSDQPEGAVLHFFDRAFIENRPPTAQVAGTLEKRPNGNTRPT